MKRLGLPEEVAQAIVYLGSDKSPFLSGQVLAVDGAKLAVDGGSLQALLLKCDRGKHLCPLAAILW